MSTTYVGPTGIHANTVDLQKAAADLRSAATEWSTINQSVGTDDVPAPAFNAVGIFTGVASAYSDALSFFQTLAMSGNDSLDRAATAMQASAAHYTAADTSSAQAMKQTGAQLPGR